MCQFLNFQMEKGSVYYFNPTCELAVANGSFSYMPPLLLQEMERGLSILPFIFCTEKDYVLTEKLPSESFLNILKNAGFNLPRFCSLNELESMPDGSFDTIVPWGWSPAAHFKLKNLKGKCSDKFKKSPVFSWDESYKQLFERSTSLHVLSDLLTQNPSEFLIDAAKIGSIITEVSEIEFLLEKQSALVLKAPISSSGRGVQIIRNKKLNTSNKQWISGVLKQQKYLVAEPYLEKNSDFSFQFRINDESKTEYLGYTVFNTNSNGQYKESLIHPDWNNSFPNRGTSELNEMIELTSERVKEALNRSIYAKLHRGYLGVDALIFTHLGQLKIQPCLEINCRLNMGILTMILEKKVDRYTKGKFELYSGKTGKFADFVLEQQQSNPPEIQNGKLKSGFLLLTEPDIQNKFGAYIILGNVK